ncbi:MAG: cytochrome c [Acidobacteria bacterium]|nr:cytochrome c [Acidobacteriota bacterium]
MQNQNKMRPYRESTFYPDGASARPLPAHTVARGDLRADEALYTGIRGGKPVADIPFPVTREVLLRGEQRYDIFCSPCHGRVGDGRGMIVTRGYKQPPSFHSEQLRNAQVGWFFSVMTQGFGVMPSYAAQVTVADRWAIAAYVRALQYSQNARLADLPADTRQKVAGELSPGAPGGASPAPAPGGLPPAQAPAPAGAAPAPGAAPPAAAPAPGAAPPPASNPAAGAPPPPPRHQTSEVP